jgi:hypothetical protein
MSYLLGKIPSPEEAKKLVLGLFDRLPGKALLVGPISMELGRSYGLNETFEILEELVRAGLLRRAERHEAPSRVLAYIKL